MLRIWARLSTEMQAGAGIVAPHRSTHAHHQHAHPLPPPRRYRRATADTVGEFLFVPWLNPLSLLWRRSLALRLICDQGLKGASYLALHRPLPIALYALRASSS